MKVITPLEVRARVDAILKDARDVDDAHDRAADLYTDVLVAIAKNASSPGQLAGEALRAYYTDFVRLFDQRKH